MRRDPSCGRGRRLDAPVRVWRLWGGSVLSAGTHGSGYQEDSRKGGQGGSEAASGHGLPCLTGFLPGSLTIILEGGRLFAFTEGQGERIFRGVCSASMRIHFCSSSEVVGVFAQTLVSVDRGSRGLSTYCVLPSPESGFHSAGRACLSFPSVCQESKVRHWRQSFQAWLNSSSEARTLASRCCRCQQWPGWSPCRTPPPHYQCRSPGNRQSCHHQHGYQPHREC